MNQTKQILGHQLARPLNETEVSQVAGGVEPGCPRGTIIIIEDGCGRVLSQSND
jgi:hypothetical protein